MKKKMIRSDMNVSSDFFLKYLNTWLSYMISRFQNIVYLKAYDVRISVIHLKIHTITKFLIHTAYVQLYSLKVCTLHM